MKTNTLMVIEVFAPLCRQGLEDFQSELYAKWASNSGLLMLLFLLSVCKAEDVCVLCY